MYFTKNKTTLVPSLTVVCKILSNSCAECSCDFLYSTNCAIMHKSLDDINHTINIWRTNAIFNYWHTNFDPFDYDNFLASINYKIDQDAIVIENLIINDIDFSIKNNNKRFLSNIKAKNLAKSIIKYIENIAKEENKNKIISYIHYNLKYYDKYYKDECFELTGKSKLMHYTPLNSRLERSDKLRFSDPSNVYYSEIIKTI